MNEIVKINISETESPTVSARDLHKALEVKTAYKDWFPRMVEYGFNEGKDFCSKMSESTGGRPATDHEISLDMAKEICMLQRSEKGKQFREYFIEVANAWNTPEMIMSRALKIAQLQLDNLKSENLMLNTTIKEYEPKVEYHDSVINTGNLISITNIAKDLGYRSAQKLNDILVNNKIVYRKKNKDGKAKGYEVCADYNWLITEKYADYQIYSDKNSNPVLKFTEKGRKWIIENIENKRWVL